ncbi:MAG TPA: EF-P lysine aminoacylase EpmA [Syntrophales bacterium]|nr:EF-P lysine aminoacylase EpmA [Syntrophales bacterium]
MEEDGSLAGKRALIMRAQMVRAMRDFLIARDYLEVETPQLIAAPIPEAHIDAVTCGDLYLHTSPEQHMKRLLAAGHPKIFQICKCFRRGERGSHHLPEFTMLEWYYRGMDYRSLMGECEELVSAVARDIGREDTINYQGKTIGLKRPWETVSVREAFVRYAPLSMERAVTEGCFDEIMVTCIEPHLGRTRPTFILDYPVSASSLAGRKHDDPTLSERFELYIGGIEIANACTELTDPDEHRRRFEDVNRIRKSAGKQVYPVSEDFLSDVASIGEAAGIALGVDRLAMIFSDSAAIDCVVPFVPESM